jgi:transposase
MSLPPEPIEPVPEETARVARAAFRRGNPCLQLRDVLGSVYTDEAFADLFPRRGQSAEAPWRLALVTVLQFAEGLSDRQAAEAVRGRIDWKYALGLALDDPGFDFSVLSEFRARLLAGAAEQRLLDVLLEQCQARGLLKARGRQRTDATRVLGALRQLNRLECVGETLRQALNALAGVAPDWLRALAPPEWFERYGRRIEDGRLPTKPAERQRYAELIGRDGWRLLEAVYAPAAPPALRELEAVQLLRRVWVHQYELVEGQLRWRDPKNSPPPGLRLDTPYEPEARYGTKRTTSWVGYKVHLTETCDPDDPHLITHVETTTATTSDVSRVTPIHRALRRKGLLPGQHLVDAAYISADELVASQSIYGVDLLGPIQRNGWWQAKADQGYDVHRFAIDWPARTATCPQGKTSVRWVPTRTPRGQETITVAFAFGDCTPCSVRSRCTRSKSTPRGLTLRPEAQHRAIQAARERQASPTFTAQYAARAGIEGTLAQGVRAFGLRRARYRGLARTHLQHVATATAINVTRLFAWFQEVPRAPTRRSRFAALAPAA